MVTADIDGLVQTALSRRPELLSLRDDRDAASHFAKSQRDSRLPTINAVGMAGTAAWRDPELPPNYAVGGIQLSLPLRLLADIISQGSAKRSSRRRLTTRIVA